jgi:DNA-binding protein H-NS
MRFLRSLARNQGRNKEVHNITEKVTEHINKWQEHVERMQENHILKKVLNYGPRGHKTVARSAERCVAQGILMQTGKVTWRNP